MSASITKWRDVCFIVPNDMVVVRCQVNHSMCKLTPTTVKLPEELMQSILRGHPVTQGRSNQDKPAEESP